MDQTQILLLLTPVVLVQLGLLVLALRDLLRPERRVRMQGHYRRSEPGDVIDLT